MSGPAPADGRMLPGFVPAPLQVALRPGRHLVLGELSRVLVGDDPAVVRVGTVVAEWLGARGVDAVVAAAGERRGAVVLRVSADRGLFGLSGRTGSRSTRTARW